MSEFLTPKYGIYIITFFLFVFLGFLLRFLFGPKGIFKDENLTYGDEPKKDKED